MEITAESAERKQNPRGAVDQTNTNQSNDLFSIDSLFEFSLNSFQFTFNSSKRVFPPQNLLLLLFYLILLSSTLLKRFLESPVPSQSPSNQPLIRPKTRPSTAGRVPPPGSKKGVETRGLVHIIVLANRANRVHSDLQATWLRNIEKSCHSGKHP